jgi:predicted phage tail protein
MRIMFNDVYIVGIGMTRFGKMLDRSVKSLVTEAVKATIADRPSWMDNMQSVGRSHCALSVYKAFP